MKTDPFSKKKASQISYFYHGRRHIYKKGLNWLNIPETSGGLLWNLWSLILLKKGSVFKESLYKFSEIPPEGGILSYDSRSLTYLKNDI